MKSYAIEIYVKMYLDNDLFLERIEIILYAEIGEKFIRIV